jgi:peptidoglycan/xylan/chitin deacetylase (PgdA/CDA1 family)
MNHVVVTVCELGYTASKMHIRHHKKFELVIIIISLLTIILINAGLFISYFEKRKISTANYYEETAFDKPKDLATLFEASVSAKITPKPKIKLPIILYHYVEYVKDKGDTMRQKLDTVPAEFDRQVKTLVDAGYTFYFFKDVPDIVSGKIKAPARSIVLTFDDGYEDYYTDALAILMKYQVKSTIFVVPHFIGKNNYIRENQFEILMKNPLVEIASHTLDHTSLKGVSVETARHQIEGSKKWFADKGYPVATFAYPYGSFSKDTIEIVKEAGYTAAASVIYGNMQSEENVYYLSRIRPGFLMGNNVVSYLEKLEK